MRRPHVFEQSAPSRGGRLAYQEPERGPRDASIALVLPT